MQVQGCFEGGAAGWVELEPAEQHPGGVGGAGQAPAGVRVGVVPVGAGGVQDVQEPGGEVVDGSGAELPGVFGEERVDLAGAGGAVVVDRGQDPSGDPAVIRVRHGCDMRCDMRCGWCDAGLSWGVGFGIRNCRYRPVA